MNQHVTRQNGTIISPTLAPSSFQPGGITLSVAIPTSERGEVLLNTLHNLIPQAKASGCPVIVIDQTVAHPAHVQAALSSWQREESLHWIVTTEDSLTGKRNMALKAASTDLVFFIDDDVILPPGLLDRHKAAYHNRVMVGITGQVYHARNPDHPPSIKTPEKDSIPHFAEPQATFTRASIGCNHSVLREAALAIGGYDEQFIASSQCEDFDLADRLVDAGYRIWYDPSLWLIHLRVKTGGTRDHARWPEWTRTANIFLYLFRHGHHHSRRKLLWRALRTGPLRREVIIHPQRWLSATWGCLRGLCYGWKHRKFRPALFT